MRSIALLLCTAPLLAEPAKPVLLRADANCFVHAVRGLPEVNLDRVERIVGPGQQVLHTVRATGEMTVLVSTGTVAINTRRVSYLQTRILGVAADTERLYVLVWSSGRVFDRPMDSNAPIEGGTYEFRTFWLGDGQPLAAPKLGGEGLPKCAPPEAVDKGPLRLANGGVECYGTRAVYEGRELQP